MVLKICPRCNQRYSHQPYDVDIVHQCSNVGSALLNEDVVVYGDWSDYTGSGVSRWGTNVLMQGQGDERFGTRAWVDGVQPNDPETPRGANADTHRSRKHNEYIKLKEEED